MTLSEININPLFVILWILLACFCVLKGWNSKNPWLFFYMFLGIWLIPLMLLVLIYGGN
jgi:NADH:ubiquinone oxidoreductase subunit 4 (subunit M)